MGILKVMDGVPIARTYIKFKLQERLCFVGETKNLIATRNLLDAAAG